MKPRFFATLEEWRDWLLKNHDSEKELLVGFHKRDSGRPSITWPESVDGVLCFGWIDGVRKRIDETRYQIRFTPRKKASIWSAINIRRVGELEKAGLMHDAGRKVFAARDEKKTQCYSYERKKGEVLLPLVGEPGQARGDARATAEDLDRGERGGAGDSAAHAAGAWRSRKVKMSPQQRRAFLRKTMAWNAWTSPS